MPTHFCQHFTNICLKTYYCWMCSACLQCSFYECSTATRLECIQHARKTMPKFSKRWSNFKACSEGVFGCSTEVVPDQHGCHRARRFGGQLSMRGWLRWCIFRKFCKFLAGSFSAVSNRNFARKYAFDSIFQALQYFHTFVCTSASWTFWQNRFEKPAIIFVRSSRNLQASSK